MSALGIRTILAATDLSDALVPALQSAARLAELTDASLHVVHTTETPIEAHKLDDHVRAAGIEPRLGIETQILVGPPGALITQEAARIGADVIVLGPHKPNPTKLGSTAYRVVYGAQTPCLMLPAALSLPLRNVLVPLDISEPARGALAVGITWASALRRRNRNDATRLTALHVAANPQEGAPVVEQEVERVRQVFGDAIGVDIDTRTESGAPASVIREQAERGAYDMIVMATRGETPQKAALGSVSLDVVMKSACPVLLVPPGVWR